VIFVGTLRRRERKTSERHGGGKIVAEKEKKDTEMKRKRDTDRQTDRQTDRRMERQMCSGDDETNRK
jgi:hypothetical protein